MKFSYDWLQSFFQKKLPRPEKLAEFLTMHFAEVEEVKKEGRDFILDIDIRPNRAGDCFSHLGIAREISAILSFNCQAPFSKTIENRKTKAKDFVSVKVENKTSCPRYTARVLTEVKVASSPKWIKDRLKACGLRPINNIVDIANYVMLETGQPMHAFDGEKLENNKIIVRFAKKGEKITTLDEEKYDLDEDILIIADSKRPLAIAGIKGGIIAEITQKTKIIVLESANFNRVTIRRASRKLNLKTDASLRFDHGIDPNLTALAISRAAFLIQKLAKGKVAQETIDFYPQKVFTQRIRLDLNYVERLLGVKIPEREIRKILEKLSFKIKNLKLKIIEVEVPTFRMDISVPEDLIEEVGRIYGYEKIPAKFPIAVLVPPKKKLDIFWENLSKNILKEVGFTEVYNYSFLSKKDAEIFGYLKEKELGEEDKPSSSSSFANARVIEVENPISVEYKYLRSSLIPNLLKNIAKNQRNFKEIKIFELGKIFFKKQKTGGEKQIKEKRMLSGVVSGDAFHQAKGVIDLLLNKLGISNIWYDEYQPTPEESKLSIWEKRKCAEIKINSTEIGFLGAISSKILEKMKIENPVIVFDLDFEKLSRLASEEQEYRPISRYPAAVRDLAVLIPREVRVEEVLNIIEASGGPLVRDVDLFDIYEGEEIPGGKKNLAFHIIYQAEDGTLSSKEIDEIQDKIIKALEKNADWEVRK